MSRTHLAAYEVHPALPIDRKVNSFNSLEFWSRVVEPGAVTLLTGYAAADCEATQAGIKAGRTRYFTGRGNGNVALTSKPLGKRFVICARALGNRIADYLGLDLRPAEPSKNRAK